MATLCSMVILDRFLWCHLKCIVWVLGLFLGEASMLGHGAGIGYGPRPSDMGTIDNFSLVTGSNRDENAFLRDNCRRHPASLWVFMAPRQIQDLLTYLPPKPADPVIEGKWRCVTRKSVYVTSLYRVFYLFINVIGVRCTTLRHFLSLNMHRQL